MPGRFDGIVHDTLSEPAYWVRPFIDYIMPRVFVDDVSLSFDPRDLLWISVTVCYGQAAGCIIIGFVSDVNIDVVMAITSSVRSGSNR